MGKLIGTYNVAYTKGFANMVFVQGFYGDTYEEALEKCKEMAVTNPGTSYYIVQDKAKITAKVPKAKFKIEEFK